MIAAITTPPVTSAVSGAPRIRCAIVGCGTGVDGLVGAAGDAALLEADADEEAAAETVGVALGAGGVLT